MRDGQKGSKTRVNAVNSAMIFLEVTCEAPYMEEVRIRLRGKQRMGKLHGRSMMQGQA